MLAKSYQVLIIDPEGDYRSLGVAPRTLVLGRPGGPLPTVADMVNFVEWHETSLVLDLSTYTLADRSEYTMELLLALRNLRTRRGRPHYVLVDELQNLCPPESSELGDTLLESMQWGGFCIISYRPSLIPASLLAALSHWLLTRLNLPEETRALEPHLAKLDNGLASLEQLAALPRGHAYLAHTGAAGNGKIIKFQIGPRSIPHIRHLHKYLRAPLPRPKRFYFHSGDGRYLNRAAANLWEFRQALAEVPLDSIRYHLERGDFERWLENVVHDDELARRIRKVAGRGLSDEPLRQALLEVVMDRYEELAALV